jgi:hypothetical protein
MKAKVILVGDFLILEIDDIEIVIDIRKLPTTIQDALRKKQAGSTKP